MKIEQKITWISFLVTLSALNFPNQAMANQFNRGEDFETEKLENRLHKIAVNLKEREKHLNEELSITPMEEIAGSWVKGRRGSFLNRRGGGGGGFLNRRRWGDRRGFYNYRRY